MSADTGTVASLVTALFESTSGFTTTGATVLGEMPVEQHGHAMLVALTAAFWGAHSLGLSTEERRPRGGPSRPAAGPVTVLF